MAAAAAAIGGGEKEEISLLQKQRSYASSFTVR
jgi:hypothetical protein